MTIIVGHFATPNASKYLQQLCKHFGHKVDVEYDESAGLAALPCGPARMTATAEGLSVSIDLEDLDNRQKAQSIIDSHLERFAFREDFKAMNWTTSD